MKAIMFAVALGLIAYPFIETVPGTTHIFFVSIGSLMLFGMFPTILFGIIIMVGGGVIGWTMMNEYNNNLGWVIWIISLTVGIYIIQDYKKE